MDNLITATSSAELRGWHARLAWAALAVLVAFGVAFNARGVRPGRPRSAGRRGRNGRRALEVVRVRHERERETVVAFGEIRETLGEIRTLLKRRSREPTLPPG